MLGKMPNLNAKCYLENSKLILFHKDFSRTLPRSTSFLLFFTPAGYGTEVAEGKEVREFNGKMHIMEHAFQADFAIVKAWKGRSRKSSFQRTARNFNPCMAGAAKITIAEVEELCPLEV
jgi:acyl CoA:acetate/3-ketoacid CoA transferase alpha subunit